MLAGETIAVPTPSVGLDRPQLLSINGRCGMTGNRKPHHAISQLTQGELPMSHRTFGRISASPLWSSGLPRSRTVREVVSTFLKASEGVALRWYDSRKGIMLLVNAPYESASGAIYVYDRQRDMWYMLNFSDVIDTAFTAEAFEHAYKEYKLLNYVVQPGLLLNLLEIPEEKQAPEQADDSGDLLRQLEEFSAQSEAAIAPEPEPLAA